MYHIELDLEAVSWVPSRKAKYTFYNPRDKEKQITTNLLMQQWHGTPLTDYLKLTFKFIHEVPKSVSKKRKRACLDGELFPTRKDLSNCVKFYEDCLKKIVIIDDRIVVKIEAEKLYGEKSKIIIDIEKVQTCA